MLGERIDVESKPAVGSAFVLFHRQVDAHAFAIMPRKELPFKATAFVSQSRPCADVAGGTARSTRRTSSGRTSR